MLFLGASSLASAQDAPADLATLTKADGKVMVNRGTGYVSTNANTPLKDGDRVITLSASSAEVVFSDGCRAQLKEKNLLVISAKEGCKAAIVAVNGSPTAGAVATAGSGPSLTQIALPVLAAGAVFAVSHSNSGSDNTPISPQ